MSRAIKVLFNSIRRLSFKKIVRLLRLNLSHPLFSVLSLYATLKAFSIAHQQFPKSHAGDGVGNAFRHSLWCCLIMMYCCKISSPQKALRWCKKFTDLHEDLFPNEPLETQMDLHNNRVGMDTFIEMLEGIHRQFFETQFFIDKLLIKTKTAKKLEHKDDLFENELVYLS